MGLRHRDVARGLGLGVGIVCRVLQRAQAAGLDWAQVEALSDEAAGGGGDRILRGEAGRPGRCPRSRRAPTSNWFRRELDIAFGEVRDKLHERSGPATPYAPAFVCPLLVGVRAFSRALAHAAPST